MSWRNALHLLAPIALAVGVLAVAVRGDLALYIHPRYQLFTVIAAVVACLLFCAHAYYRYQHPVHATMRHTVTLFALSGVLIFVPSYPLLPQHVQSAQNVPFANQGVELCDYDELTSPPRTLSGWKILFANCGTPGTFDTLPITVEGIVQADPTSYERFIVSRLVISCCAVDAAANTIHIQQPDWQSRVKTGQWVRVSGTLKALSAESTQYIITAPTLTPIPEPRDPYELLSDDIPG